MTDSASLVNLALQSFGSRTTLTPAQLAAGSNNEAKQANLVFDSTRNVLLRMAPWNCAMATTALTLLASNTDGSPWIQGLPRPPWVYEYAYPADCLKPCWIDPGVYNLGPVLYKVGVDTVATVEQRVILTNQADAVLIYVRDVTNPDIWDILFQDAFCNALGANICMSLTGDKALANMCIQMANRSIEEARKADGNEGLTINDVMPDWIRARGVSWSMPVQGVGMYDWGGLIPSY